MSDIKYIKYPNDWLLKQFLIVSFIYAVVFHAFYLTCEFTECTKFKLEHFSSISDEFQDFEVDIRAYNLSFTMNQVDKDQQKRRYRKFLNIKEKLMTNERYKHFSRENRRTKFITILIFQICKITTNRSELQEWNVDYSRESSEHWDEINQREIKQMATKSKRVSGLL